MDIDTIKTIPAWAWAIIVPTAGLFFALFKKAIAYIWDTKEKKIDDIESKIKALETDVSDLTEKFNKLETTAQVIKTEIKHIKETTDKTESSVRMSHDSLKAIESALARAFK